MSNKFKNHPTALIRVPEKFKELIEEIIIDLDQGTLYLDTLRLMIKNYHLQIELEMEEYLLSQSDNTES